MKDSPEKQTQSATSKILAAQKKKFPSIITPAWAEYVKQQEISEKSAEMPTN